MLVYLNSAVLTACVLVATLVAVHLWSSDKARRRRAFRLIKLLFGR